MADEEEAKVPATTPQTTPAPLSWQTAPPGPPGAAVDPPPCSPAGTPFIAPVATRGTGEHTYDGIPPPPWSPDRVMYSNGIGQPPWHPQLSGQPRGVIGMTVQPALLGKETSAKELARLMKRDHAPDKPRGPINGNTTNAEKR